MPRTTAWEKSLAILSTNPVNARTSMIAPKMTPDIPMTCSVIIAG